MKEIFNEEELDLIVPYKEVKLAETTHIFNDHSLITHKISLMRDVNTPSSTFRALLEEVTMLMASYAFADLPMEEYEVQTPVCKTTGYRIAGKKMVLVPVMRAGDGMEPAMKRIMPQTRTGFCGLFRDEITREPHEYFWKMPKDIKNRMVVILDPMLATGGSMDYTIKKFEKLECKTICVMAIIAAPRGVDLIQEEHPGIPMYIGHLDKGLNEDDFIVPGLGDAGDRIFGTK